MDPQKRKIKQEIVTTSNQIRKKLKALKEGLSDERRVFERVHEPILAPLKQIADNTTSKKPVAITKGVAAAAAVAAATPTVGPRGPPLPPPPPEEDVDSSGTSSPETSARRRKRQSSPFYGFKQELGFTSPSTPEEEEEQGLRMLQEPGALGFLEQYRPLFREYVTLMVRGDRKIDKSNYGVKYDYQTDKWSIGDSPIIISDATLKIKDKTYRATDGLLQLLTLKHPLSYTNSDATNYITIIIDTNAHRKNFDPLGSLVGHRGSKYNKFIKRWIVKRLNPTGKGITTTLTKHTKESNNKPVEYVYWNKVSELVQRLRLLHASKMAGHSNHHNEINSILEELREEGIIE